LKRPVKWKIFSTTAAAVLAFILLFTVACSQTVATVNDIPVKQDEVDLYMSFILSQDPDAASSITDEGRSELEINIIDSLLVVKLLEQYAEANNIMISQEEIDMQMDTIIASYESESAFEADLKERNVDRGFLEKELKSQILRNKIFIEATAEVIVTEEQVREYYDENRQTMFTTPERVRVSHILSIFPWVQDQSIEENEQGKKDALDKIEYVRAQLENGAEFGDMAREYSDDASNSADGGDLGFITRGQMVEEFEEAAFSLEIGEVSGIVETRFGYHIIKVYDRQEAGVQEFEEIKEDISTYLSELYKLEKWEEFIMGLIQEADIEYMTETEGTLNSEPEDGTGSDTGLPPDEGDSGAQGDSLLDDESLEDFIEESN